MNTRDFLNLTAGDRVAKRGSVPPIRGTVKSLRMVVKPGHKIASASAVVTWDNQPANSYDTNPDEIKLIFEQPPKETCIVCRSEHLTYVLQWDWQRWDSNKEINIDEMTLYYLCWSCGQAFGLGQMRPNIETHRLLIKVD